MQLSWLAAYKLLLIKLCLFPELPESMCLQFKCGVQIQLGFAAEFSNVMIVYTRIVKKPPEITVCKAYVTDFPLVSWRWKFAAVLLFRRF